MASTDTTSLAGTYNLDPVHSTAGFAVKYMAVTTFKSKFNDISGSLVVAEDGSTELKGAVQVASIDIDNEQFKGHVLSPDFFDVEKNPEISFTSASFTTEGGDVTIEGDLTINGSAQRVIGKGELEGPIEDAMGNTRVAIAVETKIDRTAFGINWNAPLPKGGNALANEVKLTLELAFVKA